MYGREGIIGRPHRARRDPWPEGGRAVEGHSGCSHANGHTLRGASQLASSHYLSVIYMTLKRIYLQTTCWTRRANLPFFFDVFKTRTVSAAHIISVTVTVTVTVNFSVLPVNKTQVYVHMIGQVRMQCIPVLAICHKSCFCHHHFRGKPASVPALLWFVAAHHARFLLSMCLCL